MFLLLTFWTVLNSVFLPQEPDIRELRKLLRVGADSKENGKKLFDAVGSYSGDNAVFIAYKAAAHAVNAIHAGNPFKKLKLIKTSANIFNEAVQRDNNNLEIRFVRYAVEMQTPARIKLSKHVEEDKIVLVQAIRDYPKSGLEAEVAHTTRDFMKQFCKCSEEEHQVLNKAKLD